MNRLITSAIAAVVVSASVVHAQSAVEGLGLRPCSDVVAAKTENQELYRGFATWLEGFVSAANAYEADTYDLTPWQPAEMAIAQVAEYCAANPERRMAEAVSAYLAFLREDRVKEPSTLISTRNGERAVFVYEDILDRIRQKLRDTGDLGPTEGDTFDKAFGQAIVTFQQEHGLTVTGLPDTNTLLVLFRK